MGWRDWPYWLKGGIISLCTWLLLIIGYFLTKTTTDFTLFYILLMLISIVIEPIFVLFNIANDNNVLRQFLSSLIVFLIGVLLGYIYGKIKNRNAQVQE